MSAKNIVLAFAKSLKGFIGSTAASMAFARECSHLALEQFKLHGDLSLCQQFLDAMPKNYVRRAAFLKWLKAFAPVTMDDKEKKLVKDKSDGAIDNADIDLEAAFKEDFWNFAPDPEQVLWAETDVVKSLENAVKKFHKDHYKAASETAKAQLKKAEDFIGTLKQSASA